MRIGAFCVLFLIGIVSAEFTNVDVVQTITADSHILKIESKITIDVKSGPPSPYVFLVDPVLSKHLAHIEATTESTVPMTVGATNDVSNIPAFNILVPGATEDRRVDFVVTAYYTRVMTPKPSTIMQSEKQFVELKVNVGFQSNYPTSRVKTIVILPDNAEVMHHSTEFEPVQKKGSKITYGPYVNLRPLDKKPAVFNFENSAPFLAITSLERTIEISHWGNIAVENQVDIRHYGAKLAGPFSRLDYQRGIGHHASVPSIKSVLPASARDIYYRDEIGNISTSKVRTLYNSVEVDLTPRFPLFGGWKTFFILGYNLPAHENLYRDGNRFGLKMSIVDFLYEDQLVDEMTLRIVLPETVTNIKLETPYPVDRLPDEVVKTYLDTTGRTVLVIRKKNLVESHIKDFTVYYEFSMVNMLREPAMLVTAFLLLFTVIIVYVRLDFSLSTDKMAEFQQRVQAMVDEILSQHNKRTALYQTHEDVVSSFKASKDANRFQAEFRKLENDHKVISKKISELQDQLRPVWSEGADKVQDLQKLDVQYRELLSDGASLAERVVGGKLSKPQYQTADSDLSNKKVGLIEKMETIADSL